MKEEKNTVWKFSSFCILLLCLEGFIILKIKSFIQSPLCLWSRPSDLVFSGVDRRPGHLISCQKWPQLQVNRSPISSLYCNGSGRDFLDFDTSLYTLEMSGEAVPALQASSEHLKTLTLQPLLHALILLLHPTFTLLTLNAPVHNTHQLDIDPRPVSQT